MARASRGITLREVQAAERRRVKALLERDRADAAEERLRAELEAEVADGKRISLAEVALGPTPEQLAKGHYYRFTPRLPNGTVKTSIAYRRKHLPQVARLILSGVIDAAGFRDCVWYRNLYEKTGLSGNIPSIDYGREVFVAPHDRAMFADHQVEAQDTFRFIRANIAPVNLVILDQVVLEDVPIYKAQRIIGAGWRSARRIFGEAVADLHRARDLLGCLG